MKRPIHSILLFAVITAMLVFAASQLRAYASPNLTVNNEEALTLTCQDILSKALSTLQKTCDQLGRNSACYGNNQVQVEAALNTTPKFDTVGDRVSIREIKTLITSPLDVQKGTWGLSMLKLQATLPDTLPGQNVMFLVYGNTSVQNASGDMQSFYFSSGLGSPDCKAAPRDGILVRSPNHTQVAFTANGVRITIASTVLLTATANQNLTVRLIEGHANVTTAAGSQNLMPGQSVSVPLAGATGLEASGAPTVPVTTSADATLQTVIAAANRVAAPDTKVNFSIEGCVTSVNGNVITIAGKAITVVTDGHDKKIKVGDCLHIEGNLITGMLNTVAPTVLIEVSPQAVKTSQAQGNGQNSGNGNNTGNGNSGNSGNQGNSGDKDKNKGGNDDKKKADDNNGNKDNGDKNNGNKDNGDKNNGNKDNGDKNNGNKDNGDKNKDDKDKGNKDKDKGKK